MGRIFTPLWIGMQILYANSMLVSAKHQICSRKQHCRVPVLQHRTQERSSRMVEHTSAGAWVFTAGTPSSSLLPEISQRQWAVPSQTTQKIWLKLRCTVYWILLKKQKSCHLTPWEDRPQFRRMLCIQNLPERIDPLLSDHTESTIKYEMYNDLTNISLRPKQWATSF